MVILIWIPVSVNPQGFHGGIKFRKIVCPIRITTSDKIKFLCITIIIYYTPTTRFSENGPRTIRKNYRVHCNCMFLNARCKQAMIIKTQNTQKHILRSIKVRKKVVGVTSLDCKILQSSFTI